LLIPVNSDILERPRT